MILSILSVALASPVEFYGFGGRKMGRAGEGVALADGPESILSNPAALPGNTPRQVSVGALGTLARFEPIPAVWWDTNRDGRVDSTDAPLELGPAHEPVSGALVGAVYPITETLTIGAAFYLPTARLIRVEAFEPQLPTYVFYANRAQRYELGLAAGWRPAWGLGVGGGVQVIPRTRLALDATFDLRVRGASEGDAQAGDVLGLAMDVHRLQVDLVPDVVPSLSLHWDAGEALAALEGLELGASWRGEGGLPVTSDIDLQVNAGTEDLGDLEDVVVPLVLGLQLGIFDHYVPAQWIAGAGYTWREKLTLSADLKRTAWDRMQFPVARLTDGSASGPGVQLGAADVLDGNPLDVTLRATWSPRVGVDVRLPGGDVPKLGRVHPVLRGGVGVEPSPLVTQGPETALLDAGRTVFALGVGAEAADPLRVGHESRLDAFTQVHRLAPSSYARAAPAVPTAGYPVNGGSIPIGGTLPVAGLQWSTTY
jgi:hypothetical protein